jgi:hypothetical protein
LKQKDSRYYIVVEESPCRERKVARLEKTNERNRMS